MDSILNCSCSSMEPDYYSVLGCDELSTVEQILAEYKVRALQCHPDKHPGDKKAVEDFQRLQQAKETLANEESRAQYDHWRRSKILIPFSQWEALQDSVKTSMHWAVQNKKEPMLEAPTCDPSKMPDEVSSMCDDKKNESDLLDKTQEDNEVLSPKSPQGSLDTPYNLLHFRWSAEAPSDLLRKFRNYEI